MGTVQLKFLSKDPTTYSLLFSNILTIIFAVLFNWSLIVVLWVYWTQSIIIGFFNFFKILTLSDFSTENIKINKKPVSPTKGVKIFTAFFFALHFGLFHLVYFFFLVFFTFQAVLFKISSGAETPFPSIIGLVFLPLSGLIFFFNHLFSFIHYKNKPHKKKQSLGRILFSPYVRIVPMHLTIILGGFFMFFGAFNQAILVFFLLLKTAADVAMHSLEHSNQ